MDGQGIQIIPGRMMLIGNWKENQLHGRVDKYDSNGSKTEYSCKDGKEHGKWTITALEEENFGAP
jgi:antitoxin component YwqK of YwqJK toxin-antitoxin module